MTKQIIYGLVFCLSILAGCSNDNGTGNTNLPPTISSVDPNEVSQGQINLTVHIRGTNLNGVTSLGFGGGISVNSFHAKSSNEIEAVISVDIGAVPGARTITVNTLGGTTTSTLLTVLNNRAPIAKFDVIPASGGKNTNFFFDGSSSKDNDGAVVHYHWIFGDGESANGIIVQHVFASTGNFQVTLQVQDDQNASAQTAVGVNVKDQVAPTPSFTVTPGTGDITTSFHFDASASTDDGKIESYEWHFGDGGEATGVTVDHIFKQSGKITVELIVADDDGNFNLLEKKLAVKDFDTAKATQDIINLITRFFFRYSQLETQSAEWIVEGWDPDCPGRLHEIDIIEREKSQLKSTNATIIPPIEVNIGASHITATADVTARFDYVTIDDASLQAICTHFFTLKFVNGDWEICDFTVSCL
jgi:chitodextrinase